MKNKFTLILLLFFNLIYSNSFAQHSNIGSIKYLYKNYPFVFKGKVLDKEYYKLNNDTIYSSQILKVTFLLIETYKGKFLSDTIYLYQNDDQNGLSGRFFKKNSIYNVYGYISNSIDININYFYKFNYFLTTNHASQPFEIDTVIEDKTLNKLKMKNKSNDTCIYSFSDINKIIIVPLKE